MLHALLMAFDDISMIWGKERRLSGVSGNLFWQHSVFETSYLNKQYDYQNYLAIDYNIYYS